MSTLTNVKPISAYQSCPRINVLAEGIVSGVTKMFSILAAIPDKSLTMNLMNIKSLDKNTNPVYLCNGEFGADTSAEAIVETYDFSLTLNQDYNTIINTIAPEVQRDIWKALLTGDKFDDGTGTEYVVIGVNGQRWINSATATTGLDTKYIAYRDSLLKHPARKNADGTPYLEENGKTTPFNDRPLHMFEILSSFDSSTKSGYRVAHCLNTGCTFNQDTTANNHGFDEKRLCDVFDIDEYMVDDVTDAQLINGTPATTETVYRIGKGSNGVATGRVFFMEASAQVAITGVTNGVAGDIIVAVDTADMTVDLYVVSSAAVATVVDSNYNFGLGAHIFSNYDIASSATPDLSAGTLNHGLTTVKTAGATKVAVVTDWFTNTSGSGAITGKCDFMDWEYSTQKFISYVG